ncbi:kinase-like domain-containing protein [Mycena filopes]|nr:kinase-like domain-containing protein [Mycena filopes]
MSLGERCGACGVRTVPRQLEFPAIHPFPAQSTTTLPAIPEVVPRIDIDSLDLIPFSESFSGLFDNENNEDDESEDEDIVRNDDELQMNNDEMSYEVEQFSDVKDFDSEWDDEDVAEVMVLSPKLKYSKLPTISEEQDAFSVVSYEAVQCSQPPQEDATVTLADFDLIPTAEYPMLCRKRSTSKVYVIKALSPGLHSEKVVLESVRALRAPFLEHVHWSFPDVTHREERQVYLVLDSHSGGNLVALVNSEPLAPADALFYVCEVVDGISSLHAADIIHRDVTPSNIFVDHTGHLVLSNFCNATTFSPDTACGMPPTAAMEYQAPEILLGWAHDFAVDCWSFGLLLHFLLARTNPVVDTQSDVRGQILNGSATIDNLLPVAAKDLIRKCLERNPVLRLTIGKVREHNYFATVDWRDVRQKNIPPPSRSRTPSPKLRPSSEDFPLPPSRLSQTLDASLDFSFTFQTASKAVPFLPRLERIHAANDIPRPSLRSFSSMEDVRTRKKLRRLSLPAKSTSNPTLRRRNTQTVSLPSATDIAADIAAADSLTTFSPRLSLQIQTPDCLPPIFRPTVLDARVVEEEEPSHSSPAISSPTICEMSPGERMARFWERLDEESQSTSASSAPSLELRDAALRLVLPCPPLPIARSRSNRLRKRVSAASVRPEQRFSVMSATQATGKLQKLRRPLSTPLLAKRAEPILHLPPGVEQIGKGIGFTYRVPAASRSKASICTSTSSSSAARRFLRSGLGFGKGILRRVQSQPRLPPAVGGGVVVGVGIGQRRGPPARIQTSREFTSAVTPGLHSPASIDGPLTPDSISFPPLPEPEIVGDPFAKDGVGEGPGSTLRLVAVSPSEYRLPFSPTVQPLDNFIFSTWNK